MDKQLFKLLVQLNTIATIVVAITSGVMSALDKSELRNPDVEANSRDNAERMSKLEKEKPEHYERKVEVPDLKVRGVTGR